MERSVLRGVASFRWLALAWAAVVVYLARRSLERPTVAVALLLAAGAVTVWLTMLLRRSPERLTSPLAVGVESGTAIAIQLADGWAYEAGHVLSQQPALGAPWPLAAVLMAGIALGPAVGALAGIAVGLARAVSSALHVVQPAEVELWLLDLTAVQGLSLIATVVLHAFAGGVTGHAMRLLRAAEARVTTAERRVAQARAREEVARRLHDGVLQTLALVVRRAEDPQLARLARDQERDLRAFVAGAGTAAPDGRTLAEALRAAARRFEDRYELRAEVVLPGDLPTGTQTVVAAIAGAVGEALTNVGKHADASTVVVYAEPTDAGVFVSVRDDGRGFEPAAVRDGVGLARSIRGRVEEVGGDVEVASRPGGGTEIRLNVPVPTPPA